MPEAILFENANFHGAHKHVFTNEPNLNAADDNFFNDKVSSIVILGGAWAFYRNANFNTPYGPVLGTGLYPSVTAIGIRNDDMSSLQPVSTAPTTHGAPIGGHVVLFENANFHGAHKHVFAKEPNLNAADDNFFNDKVSSIVILGGAWAFYRNANFDTPYGPVLGTGLYPNVTAIGIRNDDMSSLQPVSTAPTVHGAPIGGQVVLFENANFHGAHKHVFTKEPNLNASDDNFFNDRVSSVAVLSSVWAFFKNANYDGKYPPLLGPKMHPDGPYPGLYPFVGNIGIQNDDMSSLEIVQGGATIQGLSQPLGHVVLFENAGFHGAHKHVFTLEGNLNASDDNFFNDRVSSIVVEQSVWAFYRNSGMNGQYPRTLGPGLYSFVVDYGIQNDDMSSLQPI